MNRGGKIEKIYEVMADKTLGFGCIIGINEINNWSFYERWRVISYQKEKDMLYFEFWDWITKESNPEYSYRAFWTKLKIIGHPVMIGDVLRYVDYKCFFFDTWEALERDIDELNKCLRRIFYEFINKHDKPIEEQSDECIDFIYWFINNGV